MADYAHGERGSEMLRAIKTIKGLQRQAPPLVHVPRRGKLPLSFSQERMWVLDQLEPDSPVFNTACAYRVTGPLDVAALARSLDEIARRHEILRTTFPVAEGRPVQAIMPPPFPRTAAPLCVKAPQLPVVDLGRLAASQRETEALGLVAEAVHQPFNLATGPLLRPQLLRLSSDEHVLLVATRQMLLDGRSWGVYNRELSALYAAFSRGQASPLRELPIQYVDFAFWQRKWLQGEVLKTLEVFWNQQLKGSLSPLALPIDHRPPAVETLQSAQQSLTLTPSLTEALKALSQQEGVTLFTTLLATLKTLLYRYVTREDMLVFSSAAGRNRLEIRRMIGLFSNLLPLRTDLAGDPTFRELLGRVRKVVAGAFAHQDLPFEKMMANRRYERDGDSATPFQVMFILQNAPVRLLELSNLSLIPLETDIGMTKFDLSLIMTEIEGGLAGKFTYKTDLFNHATISLILEDFQTLLESIVVTEGGPERRLSELAGMADSEPTVSREDAVTEYPQMSECTPLGSEQVSREPEWALVPPRDPLEQRLTTVWEQALGIQPIGITDNFFDLGGDSIQAVSLFAEIERVTGKVPPMVALSQTPTIEQQADALRQEGWMSPTFSLVALQSHGSRPPFFCIPGNLGNVFTDLGDLARYLGPDQPVYGLQDGVHQPTRIETLAANYLDEIHTLQPEGPFLLGGVCSGGVVAFEIAQQLSAQGQTVAFLALVETPQPIVPGLRAYFDLVTYVLRDLGQRFGANSRDIARLNSFEQKTYLRLKLKVFANLWALTHYTPQTYQGRIHLFLSEDSLQDRHAPHQRWSELATGGAQVHAVPGTHDTITRTGDAVPEETHVRVLAEQLRDCIDNALADG